MPRGNHHGLWLPTAKDIFRSRWKRFYKRCYRPRTAGNLVDRPPPHEQGKENFDGVPSPWKLRYSEGAFDSTPPDARRYAGTAYKGSFEKFMRPYTRMALSTEPSAVNLVLRCIDPGVRRRCDSGLGRPEVSQQWPEEAGCPDDIPNHVYNLFSAEATGEKGAEFLRALENKKGEKEGVEAFPVGRLYELCEEKEIMWHDVMVDPRGKPLSPRPPRGADGSQGAAGGGPDRGRFPYIDEQASLVDELRLEEVLRLRHRRSERRHPKWIEKAYQCRQRHKKYLHRRAINNDEVKERMGVLKQGLATE